MNPDNHPNPSWPPEAEPLAGHNRAAFLARATLGILGASAALEQAAKAQPATTTIPARPWKGEQDSKVKRWDVVTIGNLSRNRYWGESDARGVRSAICTCTVVQGDTFRLLVDPSLTHAEQMAAELDRRTGLKPADISTVFVTHEHGDHWFGLAHFPDARWFAAAEVAAALNKTQKLPKPVEVASTQLCEAVDVVETPGHTLSHKSLRFDCQGMSVVIAGDAVATRDFWKERRGYYNCIDFALSAQSMEKIDRLADLVVPGHDNFFLNLSDA